MKNLACLFLSCFLLLNAFAQSPLSAEDWQADLTFLHNKVHTEYPFLFKKVTSEKFDAEVDELHASIPNMEPHEIVVGFARIVSLFQYGHTSVSMSQGPVKYHKVPLNLYQFNDGIYIQGAPKDHAPILGLKVLKVEGKPVDEVLKMIKPTFPAENDQFFKAYGLSSLLVPEILHAQGVIPQMKKQLVFTLEKNGTPFEQTIPAQKSAQVPTSYGYVQNGEEWLDARDSSQTPLYLKHLDKIYFYEYLPEHKTVYVRQSQIQDEKEQPIPDFYEEVFDFIEKNDVERLVLDVRLNGGGNNYKNKPIVKGIIRTEKIDQVGKFFVITGRRTFSACQNLVNELDNYTNAIFVGEPTGENINFYGDNHRIELPNSKMPVYLSFAWWQDKPQWENGPWTAPHVAADMSFDDYRSNRDPALEAALQFDDDNYILDPMAYMTELFTTQQIDLLKSEAVRMVNDPKYRFFDFEGKFNEAGYNLLKGGQTEQAVFVFQLVNQFFPESANAWDSLAEGYRRAGQVLKAKECYKKAIGLDPDGSVGKNARKMLKEMEGQK